MTQAVQLTLRAGWGLGTVRAVRLVVVAVVVGGCAVVNAVAMAPAWPVHSTLVIVHMAMGGALAAAGLALIADPAQRSLGVLLVVDGFGQALPVLSWRSGGPQAWLSWVFGPIVIVPIGVVLLAYPAGRLFGSAERAWVGAAATWLLAGRLLLGFFPPSEKVSGEWPTLFHAATARGIVDATFNIGALLFVFWFAVLLRRRWKRTAGLDRFVDAPVAVASVAVGITAAAHLTAFATGGETRGGWPAIVQDLALAAVPLSLLAVAIARQLLYAPLAKALAALPGGATPSDVQLALAASLHDPDLEILYWADDQHGYVDTHGAPSEPTVDPGRLEVAAQASDNTPLALIRVNAAAHQHPQLLASALRLGAIALENTRLQAALLAQLQEVRDSRARIVTATLVERRRLERDLHDGAQQHLLAVAAGLGRLHQVADPGLRRLVVEVREDLRSASRQLRDLAHGIHPALLTEGGLRPALHSVAGGLPLKVRLAVVEQRFPSNVEATAYFVICEALANAAKHSAATIVHVSVDGDDVRLDLTVRDDGTGGADVRRGTGLRGLYDRVDALGGRVVLRSERGEGTELQVRLPCG